MSSDGTERLIELLEKGLMIQLHAMGVVQGDIAKILNKSKTDVNNFLKPFTRARRAKSQ